MIEPSRHTGNRRILSGSLATACNVAVKCGIEHLEFAALDG